MISDDQVRYVAKLARIALSDEEVNKFSEQLSKVIGYMKILNEVDTKNVKETHQVTGLKNIMEKDIVNPSKCKRDELLECTELPVDSNQIRVKHAIK
ncbi:Asp-tRNA(Asn)/Glu-tRNA(Gln) amidotransferase subunit GatC [Candidatus Peregrinibacteria bacterium]|nr:Asp-tRNA(Asn)/Glu-tRNA(Gln) amidotransferase subunit GatC [Candidatus Peregrinibacteria bacterium]